MDIRKERLKLRIKSYLTGLGRMYESDLPAKCNNYSKAEITEVVNELLAEGFCERAMRHGAFIVVLTGAPLEDLLQDGEIGIRRAHGDTDPGRTL